MKEIFRRISSRPPAAALANERYHEALQRVKTVIVDLKSGSGEETLEEIIERLDDDDDETVVVPSPLADKFRKH